MIRRSVITQKMFIIVGWINITLGVIGIFLPLMPTTVFLLIAAWAFGSSSPRLHQWLIEHPKLGPLLKAGQRGGMPRCIRDRTLFIMWCCMIFSSYLSGEWWIALLLFIIGFCVTIFLLRQPVIE